MALPAWLSSRIRHGVGNQQKKDDEEIRPVPDHADSITATSIIHGWVPKSSENFKNGLVFFSAISLGPYWSAVSAPRLMRPSGDDPSFFSTSGMGRFSDRPWTPASSRLRLGLACIPFHHDYPPDRVTLWLPAVCGSSVARNPHVQACHANRLSAIHSRRRSGPALPDRRAGRCRWEHDVGNVPSRSCGSVGANTGSAER